MRVLQSSSLASSRISLRSSYTRSSRFSSNDSNTSKSKSSTDKIDLTSLYKSKNDISSNQVSNAYTDINSSAEKLEKISEKIISGDTKDIYSKVESFVKEYNSLLKKMNNSGSKTYANFAKELKTETVTNQKNLAEIGISYVHDGTLSIDKKKFDGANSASIKKVFLEKDSFVSKIESKAEYIKKRASIDTIISGSNVRKSSYIRRSRV